MCLASNIWILILGNQIRIVLEYQKAPYFVIHQVIANKLISSLNPLLKSEFLSNKGNRWVERILSLRQTCRLQAISTFAVLVDVLNCYFKEQDPVP